MAISLGIDLGTTNSVAGVATPQGVQLYTDSQGKTTHASVLHIAADGSHLVGNGARLKKATDPLRTIYSSKRLIGQNVRDPMVQLAIASLGYQVEEGANQQAIIVVDEERMTIPQVGAHILGHLKRVSEEQFGDQVDSAVITVPANFSDAQRQATKEAGRLAGLEVLRLINEPTAAALAYGYGQALDERVAVFDFGGGTFDVSILKVDSDIFEVLATDGEFFLGGDDIDRIVSEFLASEMNRSLGIDPRPVPSAMKRLNVAAEQIKSYLSTNTEAGGTIDGIVLDDSGSPVSFEFAINRGQFDTMISGYVDRTIEVCSGVLASAGLQPGDISDVLMVGGSTRIPLVRERLAEFFGKEPASRINPDEVVAHGAAVQAAMLSGTVAEEPPPESEATLAEHATPIDLGFDLGGLDASAEISTETVPEAERTPIPPAASVLLLDVTPASLRIATSGGYTTSILDKNSPVPIERTRSFTTGHDGQTHVVIQCYRGEYNLLEDNELLGTLELDDIPPGTRGEADIAVTFRVDPDCILHVRAIDTNSGKEVESKLNVLGAPVEGDTDFSSSKTKTKAQKKRDKGKKNDEPSSSSKKKLSLGSWFKKGGKSKPSDAATGESEE